MTLQRVRNHIRLGRGTNPDIPDPGPHAGGALKSNGQHQKEAITTDQRNRSLDEHGTEAEKQKLKAKDTDVRQQALEKHPKDSESR